MKLDQKGSPTSESSTLNITNDENQKQNYAANQFFSSLLAFGLQLVAFPEPQ